MTFAKPHFLFPFFLVAYEIAIYLSNDMYLAAIPAMMKDLHLSASQAQWTLTCWFLGSTIMPLMVGAIAGRFGRRSILLTGGLCYVIVTAICAYTHSISLLLAARTVQGAMMATMLVPGYAVIHESYDQIDAIKTIAMMGSITIIAPALGPLIGSFILLMSNWRGIFLLIVLLAILPLIGLYKIMPETNPENNRHKLNFNIIFSQYWQVIINRKFMLLTAVLGFIVAGFLVWITGGPLLIIETFHYPVVSYGLMQALVFGVYVLGNQTVNYLIDVIALRRIVFLGISLTFASGFSAFLCAIFFPTNFYLFLASMTAYSYCSALCFAPLNRIIIESSDMPMGVRMASFTVFFTAFATLGSALSGLFYNNTIFSLASLIVMAVSVAFIIGLMCIKESI